MSSTQHQLIEQCATRLRGIVEALDNIHDTSPQRWSTDLDDVHSSAESLLALIKDQAPARSEASFEEWLANELEGEDGQPVPAAVCDIALARRAFNHWPKLEQPAKVGGVRFSAGVSSRLVVEAAQRLYEFESTPEQEAERIERLQAFREQCFEPLGTEFSKVLSDNLPDLLSTAQAEQAEAERPEIVATLFTPNEKVHDDIGFKAFAVAGDCDKDGGEFYDPEKLMTVAQHDRIVGALTRDHAHVEEHLSQQIDILRINLAAKRDNLDAALAKVAELDQALAEKDPFGAKLNRISEKLERCDALLAARATQAGQVPQAWLDVQAERRRQIEAEGWTPEHDDEHNGGELADAAACYALSAAGWSTYAARERWPWPLEWWKPSTARRDLVKACSLALAEIERLDRAGISQSPQPGATTASS